LRDDFRHGPDVVNPSTDVINALVSSNIDAGRQRSSKPENQTANQANDNKLAHGSSLLLRSLFATSVHHSRQYLPLVVLQLINLALNACECAVKHEIAHQQAADKAKGNLF
jgi:hypothetical protein